MVSAYWVCSCQSAKCLIISVLLCIIVSVCVCVAGGCRWLDGLRGVDLGKLPSQHVYVSDTYLTHSFFIRADFVEGNVLTNEVTYRALLTAHCLTHLAVCWWCRARCCGTLHAAWRTTDARLKYTTDVSTIMGTV